MAVNQIGGKNDLPSLVPVPDLARRTLLHWAYTSALDIESAARKIKVSPRALRAVIRKGEAVKKEAYTRLMRFTKRLERKGVMA